MNLEEVKSIVSNWNISFENTKEIDSSKLNDNRLNIVLDNKYVLRINDNTMISEDRLASIERLIRRYNGIGIYSPHLLKNSLGEYSIEYQDKICYISEYGDYPLANEHIDVNEEQLKKDCIKHLGLLAKLYTNFDLVETKSMWSIIDLAPLDNGIDEKQENINTLIELLKEHDELELVEKVNSFNESNRRQIMKVFRNLPRCVYQGDLNSSNILIKNNKFYGIIDFNLSGTEVNINCFLSESNRCFNEEDLKKFSSRELFNEMISYQNGLLDIIFEQYVLNDIEKQVFENYRNLIMISQYPNVCAFKRYMINNEYKPKIIELIRLILDR